MISYVSLRRWAPLLLPAAEFTWLYPWLLLLSGASLGGPALLTPGAVLALLMGGYLLELIPAAEGRAGRRSRFAVLAAALLLGVWAVWVSHYRAVPFWQSSWLSSLLMAAHGTLPRIPAPVLGAIAAPLLIWRGMALGSHEFSYFVADAAFRRGIGWSVVFALAFAMFQDARGFALVRPAAAGYLLAFVFLGLVMLSLARLLGVWAEAEARDSRGTPNRPWLALAVGVPAVIVLAAGMLGGLAGADVWPYIRPLFRLLAPLVEAVFIVLFFFAGIIARVLIFVINSIPRREPVVRPEDPVGPLDEMLRRMRDFTPSPEAISDARWGMVALAVLIFSFIIVAAAARRRRRRQAHEEEDRESVWDRADLWKGVRRLFMRRRALRTPGEPPDTPERMSIRMLYRRVLEAAHAAGLARRPAQTPGEFAARLRADADVDDTPVDGITRAYEVVRYGGHLPSSDEIAAAEEYVGRVEDALQRRIRHG